VQGLVKAIPLELPDAIEGFCAKHLVANTIEKFGRPIEQLAWSCVYAVSKDEFDRVLAVIRKDVGEEAADYLNTIEHSRWATYAFPRSRYGRVTSNTVEIMNGVYGEARELPALQFLEHLYNDQMQKFASRGIAANASQEPFATVAFSRFQEQARESRFYIVMLSSPTSARVIRAGKPDAQNREVRLDLETDTGTCSCGFFEEHLIPCRHAIALCHERKIPPSRFIFCIYHTSTLRQTYSVPYPPVLTSDLVPDKSVLPPLVKKARGRPSKKRTERGVKKGGAGGGRKCGKCGMTGHNRKKCPQV
jgi:hypothetical protein